MLITEGTRADCKEAINLIKGLHAQYLFADRGYDTTEIVNYAMKHNMEVVIPPKKNRLVQRPCDMDLYKYRHLVENAFLHLKRWRGIATRYCKNVASFRAAVYCRCLYLWLKLTTSRVDTI